MNQEVIIEYAMRVLSLLPLVEKGLGAVVGEMKKGYEALQKMVAEGRDPTPEEWDILNAATDKLRDSLHSDEY